MPLTQANRALKVTTTLGADKFVLLAFYGTEAISQLFTFDLDLLSEDSTISMRSIVGTKISFSIKLKQGERHFSGFVSRFSQLPNEGRLARYRAEVVPWLWFLTRTTDCRMYQNKNVIEIIQDVFSRFGFSDFAFEVQASFQPREYCVQYRETAFNFVSRLMEEEGIFYFFKHTQSTHQMVIANNKASHDPCPQQSRARYEASTGAGFSAEEDLVQQWQRNEELRPGKWAMRDWNFEQAPNPVSANIRSRINVGGNSSFEIYDYPGIFLQHDRGDTLVKIRMEQEEVLYDAVNGAGYCRAFTAGHRFDLVDHPRRDQNGPYTLTSVHHDASEPAPFSEFETPFSYHNQFNCIPFDTPYRPQSLTPRPIVRGCQTAVVVGDEIQVDRHARVKVKFHWERVSNDSCWIRVSQPWAGSAYGHMWIPRGGHEVIVDFLEGDPDRPIIVGRVYNGDQMPPYSLPANQTQSGFKTRSSRGGGGYNEMRLEDKKGSEEIYLQAEKDWNTLVKNDRTSQIRANETKTVGGNQKVTIYKNQEIKVIQDRTLQIIGNLKETIVKKMETTVIQDKNTTVVGKIQELSVGKHTIISAAGIDLISGGKINLIAAAGVTVVAPMIQLVAPMTQIVGVNQVAVSVISPIVTTAVGNII